jgi:hypothetical protein
MTLGVMHVYRHFHRLTNPTPSKDRSSDVSAVQPAPVMTPTPEKESGTAVEEEQIENVPALGAQAAAPKTPTKPEPEQVPEGCWSVSDFVVGGPVMILSPKGKWRECTVVAVDNSPANGRANWAGAIQVHYVGFRSEFNEWLGLAEGKRRIRVAATRAAAKLRVGLGEMSPSQRNQEFAKAKPCLPWLSDSPM